MRIILLLLFTSSLATAAGYGGAQGTNKLRQIVTLEGEGYEDIDIAVKNNSKEYRYKFKGECSFFFNKDNEASKISCSQKGRSPLAGATYKITTSKKWTPCKKNELYPSNDPGTIYICIRGCNNHTPILFYESPWEC